MTRSLLWSSALCAAALAITAATAHAQVPQTLTFSARLTDGDDALDGAHALTFRIYDAETGGTPRWTESHAAVPVSDGLATVALGSVVPLTATVLGGGTLWIEVVLDGETMAPRLALRSVPYAVRAGDAALLGGQTAAAYAAAGHDHDAAYVNASGDAMSGTLNLGGDLALGSRSALRGSDTWLRLNQDGGFTSGTHTPLNFNAAGLTVGALYFDPGAGNLDVAGTGWLRAGGRLNGVAIGQAAFGALPYPYETIQLDPSYNLRFAFGAEERMRLSPDGRLWMQSTRGDCPSGWFCNGMFWDLSVSSILYSGLNQRSDRRLKRDIQPIEDGLATVRALRPVTFAWKDGAPAGRHHGFIAQEVREVVPSLVSETPDGTLAVDTQAILPILVRAVQDLDARNAALQAEVEALRGGGGAHATAAARGTTWPSPWTLAALGLLGVVWVRRRRRG